MQESTDFERGTIVRLKHAVFPHDFTGRVYRHDGDLLVCLNLDGDLPLSEYKDVCKWRRDQVEVAS